LRVMRCKCLFSISLILDLLYTRFFRLSIFRVRNKYTRITTWKTKRKITYLSSATHPPEQDQILIHHSSITISTTPTPYAILDLHFSPHDPTLLAVAGSTGCLQLFRLSASPTSSTSASLEPLSTYQFFDPATLVLSLSWHPISANLLGVTVSEGGVYVVDTDVTVEEALDTGKEILTHELEAWTLVFSHDGKAIYSGGDDASLRFSTLADPATYSSSSSSLKTPEEEEDEEEEEEEDFTPLQWQDRRSHQAGVTAILPLASEDNILITGSYDDNIRVIHTPLQGRKQVLAEENLEGGVWRLKLLTQDPQARS
jgi:diphthamide biosynthesis protein 7